ncbi:DUF3997 domain-containing protein [Inconstantimicrobium porci]|uniref:DUF3997 domain-containing protein n=1 Tax=Inconstantimicrobium porci TaxID=2652291 RepID=A0A7X2N133_9CLOT|nr:DUF3997 domain-containing protein [Inconstantimicrobium porci]MSR92753.1 DUF3997 domain-containing protein [Inconstantimicrobium porci]
MRRKHIFFTLLLSLIFIGCDTTELIPMPSRDDYSYTINNKYEVDRANPSNIILCNTSTRDIIIESKISKIGWDENFIIIKQINPYDNGISNKGDKDIPYEKKLTEPPVGRFFYWIINCKNDKCYGPFSSEKDFSNGCKELNVSNNIKIENVDNYLKNK